MSDIKEHIEELCSDKNKKNVKVDFSASGEMYIGEMIGGMRNGFGVLI